jgi:hypothetical protein
MTISDLRAALADYPDYWPVEAILVDGTHVDVTHVESGKTEYINVVRLYVAEPEDE